MEEPPLSFFPIVLQHSREFHLGPELELVRNPLASLLHSSLVMAIALPRHHPYNIKICIRAKQINMPFTVVSTSNCLFIISPLMSIDVFNSTT